MEDDKILVFNFKIGIIKELKNKGLLSRKERDKAIEILKTEEDKLRTK